MLGRRAALLRVSLSGFDPPQVRPSGQIRWTSDVDSCRLFGEAMLGFLVVHTQQQDLVSGSLDRFKGST